MEAIRIPQPLGRPRKRPYALAGDKAYNSRWIRNWLREHKIQAVIPRKSSQPVDNRNRLNREAYRGRNVVECCVGWLKECRRIATRFEKLAINFLAMLKLAMIQRYLKLEFSDRA